LVQLIDRLRPNDHSTRSNDLIECRKGVSCGATSLAHDPTDGFIVNRQVGIGDNPPHVILELSSGEQIELKVLRSAADRG